MKAMFHIFVVTGQNQLQHQILPSVESCPNLTNTSQEATLVQQIQANQVAVPSVGNH